MTLNPLAAGLCRFCPLERIWGFSILRQNTALHQKNPPMNKFHHSLTAPGELRTYYNNY